jgi:hypothetical protein
MIVNASSARPATTSVRGAPADGFTWTALGIIIVGVALRLYTIVAFTWDQDELYTIAESRDLFHTTLPPGIDARPLYYLLEHPLLTTFPQTAFMLRLLPLIFGAAGLWITWLAARRYAGRVAGIVAVFLASVSPWHMEASGQARYYSLVYLCAALVLLWLPDAYDSQRPSRLLAACVAMALGTLTHPSFVFPIVGVVLAVSFVTAEGTVRSPWPSATAWAWLWIPFSIFVAVFLGALRLADRESALRNSVGRGDAAALRLLPAVVEWITPLVLGAALLATVVMWSSRPDRRRLAAITLLSLVVTCTVLVVASRWTSVYATYATGMLPMMFVAAGALAQGVADDRQTRRDAWAATAAVALFGTGVAPSVASHLSDGTRFDYRPAYAQIQREDPSRPVVAWPAVLGQQYAPTLTLLPYYPSRAYLDSMLTRYRDLWFVASIKRAGIALDDSGEVDRWMAERCRRRGAYERPRFDYRIYRVELYRCVAADARAAAP